MEKTPTFTIIIPLYNKINYINRAVDSVINQNFQDFELIVVNDGSTDGGEKKVKVYNDPRIKLVNQSNQGVSVARNKGIQESKGKYMAFLDADDTWNTDFLETINTLINNFPNASAFATAYEIITATNKRKQTKLSKVTDNFEGILENYFEELIKNGPPFCSSSICVYKEVFSELGYFPEGIVRGEDLDMWNRIFLNKQIAFANIPKATIYRNATNRSFEVNGPPKGELFVVAQLQKVLNTGNLDIKKKKLIKLAIANSLLYASSRCIQLNDAKGAAYYLFDKRNNSLIKRKLKLLVKYYFLILSIKS